MTAELSCALLSGHPVEDGINIRYTSMGSLLKKECTK
jgi:hypothetical protein